MESKIVKEMMIPLAEYTTVSEDANLLEAVMALEKAQVEFDQTGYRHRAILVLDQNGHIEGEFIDENETMNNAVHKLIIGKHHSLLVTQRGKIAGVLRLSDVFEKITDLLKEC